MDEREEKGVSLSEIFRVIFSQKWVALFLVFAVTILGTLAIYYGYGKRKSVYRATFTLDLPGDNSLTSRYVYPDGYTFDCFEYGSYEKLSEVKNSDNSFKDVNIESMVEKGDITVSLEYDTVGSETNALTTRTITISINAKYFENATLARAFISKLASYPVDRFESVKTNFESLNKEMFASLSTYSKQIEYIRNQIKNIDDLYVSLANDTGNNVADNDGNTIANHRSQLSAWLDIQKLDALAIEAQANYYVKDWETEIMNLRNSLEVKQKDLKYAIEERDKLLEYLTANPDYAAPQIAVLQSQVTDLTKEIEELEKYINRYFDGDTVKEEQKNKTEAYAAKITAIYDELIGDGGPINVYSTVSKQIYTKFAAVTHTAPNVAVLTGGMGITTSFIISFILGVVIACIVAYIVGWYKNRQKQLSTQTVYAIDGEMQLAAAAADESGEQLEIEEIPAEEEKDKE